MPGRKVGIPNGSRTAEALEFIRSEVARTKRFPRPGAIAAHMGWVSDASAIDCLMRLIEQGHVVRHIEGKNRMRRKYRYELAP